MLNANNKNEARITVVHVLVHIFKWFPDIPGNALKKNYFLTCSFFFISLLAEVSHEAKMRERRETSAGFRRVV